MIFGALKSRKNLISTALHMPTSPVYCSHFTLENPKKSFSTVLFIHTSNYLRYLKTKQTVMPTPLPTTPKKCHHTTLQNIQLFHLTEGMLHSAKRWWLCKKPVVGWHYWL